MRLRNFISQVRDNVYSPISEDLGINIRSVVTQLPESHRVWDIHAKNIPNYIATFRSKEVFCEMSILHATEDVLPKEFLLRASILVSGFAHAYYHPQGYNKEDPLPDSIMIPLLEIAKRINKKNINDESDINVYVGRTYLEDFLANWQFINESSDFVSSTDELQIDKLKMLAPYFDNPEESISTLITGPIMQARFANSFDHLANLQDELFKPNPKISSVIEQLNNIKNCIQQVTKALMLMNPKLGEHYVDQVIWPKTSPSMGKIHPNEAPNTGADSIIFHILDKLIARKDYESNLGKNIVYRFDFIPENYQICISIVEEIGKQLFHFVQQNSDEALKESYKGLVLAYTGDHNSLLENHRKKAYGYAKMAFLGGRLITNGNQKGDANTVTAYQATLTPWGKLHHSFQEGKKERLNVLNHLNINQEQCQVTKTSPNIKQGQSFKRYEISKYNKLNTTVTLGIFNDRVYNIANLIKTHPGGHRVLQSVAGTDMTQELQEAHATNLVAIEGLLQKYCIGYIETNSTSPEISAFINRWSSILFVITDIQNNVHGIWNFDKEQVGDSKRNVPFHFVMKTLDIIFGKDGYLDSLLKLSDQELHDKYQAKILTHWQPITSVTLPITVLDLGKKAMQYGKDEIKHYGLTTVDQTLIKNMRVYELYDSIITLSLTFLEKIKSDIIVELDQIDGKIQPSVISDNFKNELTIFLDKIDSISQTKLIEKINQKNAKLNNNLTLSAACLILVGFASYKLFETKSMSLDILAILSVAGCIWIHQTNSLVKDNHQKMLADIETPRVNLCPMGFS